MKQIIETKYCTDFECYETLGEFYDEFKILIKLHGRDAGIYHTGHENLDFKVVVKREENDDEYNARIMKENEKIRTKELKELTRLKKKYNDE